MDELWGFIFIGAVIVILFGAFISSKFERIANDKGYTGQKYFWFPFLFGIVGWIMVAALPDRKNNNNGNNTKAVKQESSKDSNVVLYPYKYDDLPTLSRNYGVERYSVVFKTPENIYSVDSPVIITAGELLRDGITGKLIIHAQLCNISDKIIKTTKIRIYPADSLGNRVGNSIEYLYQNLDIQRNNYFGSYYPIILDNDSVRSFTVAVSEVTFSDDSTWTANAPKILCFGANTPISKAIPDTYVQKLYKQEFGSDGDYMYREFKQLWICACGSFNRPDEHYCHKCGNSLEKLRAFDPNKVVSHNTEQVNE